MKNTTRSEAEDRIRAFEYTATRDRLDPKKPICARIDGRAFSTYTGALQKPFDPAFSRAMRETAAWMVRQTEARIGYVQSDEISLVFQAGEKDGASVFFDGRVQKMTSVLASMTSARFLSLFGGEKIPAFDCRVWQVPTREDAVDVLLWRQRDARRNSISSACRAVHSAARLHRKSTREMLRMLADAGIEHARDYDRHDVEGSFFQVRKHKSRLPGDILARIPPPHVPVDGCAMRSRVDRVHLSPEDSMETLIDIAFNQAGPCSPIQEEFS